MLAFSSLLKARDVFEEVKLGFLVVGHTHEDIDGCFGYLSKKLREEKIYILVYLMRAFIISQERSFIPQSIQEIPNFNSWVLDCLKDGHERLVGHTNMHLFRFFVDSLGWPMMQYKLSPIDLVWSSIDVLLIRLWKANANGSPKLPIIIPSLVSYHLIWDNDASRLVERKKCIHSKLKKYMDFWKVGIVQSFTYEMKMKLYIEYWEDILLHLSILLPFQSTTLLEGF
jgi:hypothetical protein